MSFNRENVTWESADGTWNLGFFKVEEHFGEWDEDFDPEWDVDYDFSVFEWVSTGHPSMDSATQSWDGCNPGGGTVVFYYPLPDGHPWGPTGGTPKECEKYDEMAKAFKKSEGARYARRHRSYPLAW